jgi:hypothetical protein
METRDYFAEMYVAGVFADAKWNVYFPRRDKGFDFIVSRPDGKGSQILRPVQVKGKYPTNTKTDTEVYGFIGRLSQLHPEMVLAIPFFVSPSPGAPVYVAYMPRTQIKKDSVAIAASRRSSRTGGQRRAGNLRISLMRPGCHDSQRLTGATA